MQEAITDKEELDVREPDPVCNCDLDTPELSASISPTLEETVQVPVSNLDQEQVAEEDSLIEESSVVEKPESQTPEPISSQHAEQDEVESLSVEGISPEKTEFENSDLQTSEVRSVNNESDEEIKCDNADEKDKQTDEFSEDKYDRPDDILEESTLSVDVENSEILLHSDINKLVEREVIDSDTSEAYLTPTEREVETEEIPQSVSDNLPNSVQFEIDNTNDEHRDDTEEKVVLPVFVNDSCSNEEEKEVVGDSGCDVDILQEDKSENVESLVEIVSNSETIDKTSTDPSASIEGDQSNKTSSRDDKSAGIIENQSVQNVETNTEPLITTKITEVVQHSTQTVSPCEDTAESKTETEDETPETSGEQLSYHLFVS